jgi:CRP-like cAMP-binding protein
MGETPVKLTVRPNDLTWLAEALKLEETLSDASILDGLLQSIPALVLEDWPSGQEVLREGEKGEDFFVVKSGRLSVWRKSGKPAAKPVGTLEAGDFFGEIGFLLKSARSASVRTETRCRLFRFPAGEFSSVLQRHEVLERWVKQVACARLEHMFLLNGH